MKSFPSISIVVPTFGRPKQLRACLQAISTLDYPASRFEVIVVDDGSAADIASVVAPFKAQCTIEYLKQQHLGPAAARNHGGRNALGDIVAFTDDDCLPARNWLSAIAGVLERSADALVGGKIANSLRSNIYSSASQHLIDYFYEYYEAANSNMRYFCANNMACARELFLDSAGFSREFPIAAAEDRDFCRRWIAEQHPLIYAADAVVFHAHNLTLKSFWKQQYNYGKGGYIFHRRTARDRNDSIRMEQIEFYGGLMLSPFRAEHEPKWAIAALVALSQIANASGFATEMVRSRRVLNELESINTLDDAVAPKLRECVRSGSALKLSV